MKPGYDYGLGLDTTSTVTTSSGDQLARAANYIIPVGVWYAYGTWENLPLSEEVAKLIRYAEFPQLNSPYISITSPSGSIYYIYDSTSTVTVQGSASENNDADYSLSYALTGVTSGTGSITKNADWSFLTPYLNWGNTIVQATITSVYGPTSSDSVTISRTPTLPPVATITTGTTATTAADITIIGTASDPNSLPFTLEYEVDRPFRTGTPTGTSNWTFSEYLTAGQNRFDVIVTNSYSLTGSDSLTVTRYVTGSFRDDEFDDNDIASFWTTEAGVEGSFSESGDVLTITSSDENVFSGGFADFNWIYQDPFWGDFDIAVKMQTYDGNFNSNGQRAGIVVYIDNNNWAVIGKYYYFGMQRYVNHRVDGSYAHNYNTDTNLPYWMRVRRVGSVITTYYSDDGSAWTSFVPSTALSGSDVVRVGLFANSEGVKQFTVDFDYVENYGTQVENVATVLREPAPSGYFMSSIGTAVYQETWSEIRDGTVGTIGLQPLSVPFSYILGANDNTAGQKYECRRTILSWDLSAIPTDSIIITAGMYFDQVGPGGNPIPATGCIQGANFDPSNITTADWNSYVGTSHFGTFVAPDASGDTFSMEFNSNGISFIQNSLASRSLLLMIREYTFDFLFTGSPTVDLNQVHFKPDNSNRDDFVMRIGYA